MQMIKGNISEEEKLQEFLQDNNISNDRIKYQFEDGKLVTLSLSCCKIQGTVSFKDFSNLKVLDLAYNDITDVDLTQNFNLKTLYLQNNNLTNIDITKNRNLEYLDLGYNNLTKIDLTKNSKLEKLYLPYNKLTDIDLTKNSELGKLDLENNYLTNIDLRQNTELYDIGIDPKTEIKITGNALYGIASY
jgi:Leucine-rich repeat (LRR) protein